MNPKSRKEFQAKFEEIETAGDLKGLVLLHSQLGSKLEGNIYLAAREGHWPLLRYWHDNVRPLTSGNYVEYAASGGHYDMMIWLIELGCKIKSWVLYNAVEFGDSDGHLKVIKYLYENANLEFSSFSLDRAAENDHYGIFKYLLDVGHGITKTTLKAAATQGKNLEIIDHLIAHCKANSLDTFRTNLIKRRKKIESDSLEESKHIPQSPSLDKPDLEVHSSEGTENSTETLLSSNSAPKVPAGALRFLPKIPPATNKLANFQFSESSDDDDDQESEDLSKSGLKSVDQVLLERPVKSTVVPSKRAREATITKIPVSRQPALKKSASYSPSLSKNSTISTSTTPKATKTRNPIELTSDAESLVMVDSPMVSNKLEYLKLRIKKEEVELKSNLANLEGKKIDFAKDLIEKGYTLAQVEAFMKSV